MSTNFICPQYFGIWVCLRDGTTADRPSTVGSEWLKLPGTVSWEITPDREDASEKRTDDTGGQKAKVCPGAASWTVDVVSTIHKDDFIWCYLFETTTVAAGTYVDMSKAFNLWAWCTNDSTVAPTGDYDADGGVYVGGFAEVGNFGGDNDSNDAAETEWQFQVSLGPFFGSGCAPGGAAWDPRSGADPQTIFTP